ncbi:unnamed protein product [Gulo gulo]|uniref:Uncharacterized protein n=1 Tax=Gulo gulo TaxID=48420 RepID=A0A9X9M4K2_GULGU|nr:unnamed protein product [Gulo gulo]
MFSSEGTSLWITEKEDFVSQTTQPAARGTLSGRILNVGRHQEVGKREQKDGYGNPYFPVGALVSGPGTEDRGDGCPS